MQFPSQPNSIIKSVIIFHVIQKNTNIFSSTCNQLFDGRFYAMGRGGVTQPKAQTKSTLLLLC